MKAGLSRGGDFGLPPPSWFTLRAALWYHTSCTARPWLHPTFGKRVALEPSPRRGLVWLGSSWPSCERNTRTEKVLMRQGPHARLVVEAGADSSSPTRCPRYPSLLPLQSATLALEARRPDLLISNMPCYVGIKLSYPIVGSLYVAFTCAYEQRLTNTWYNSSSIKVVSYFWRTENTTFCDIRCTSRKGWVIDAGHDG